MGRILTPLENTMYAFLNGIKDLMIIYVSNAEKIIQMRRFSGVPTACYTIMISWGMRDHND